MAATPDLVTRLRRMITEPDNSTYSNEELKEYIERYPAIDDQGTRPFWYDQSTTPPTRIATTGWIPTYDLNAAAADLWQEKAAPLACQTDFSADGGSYHRSQAYAQYMKQARYYLARRKPGTVTLTQEPVEDRASFVFIGNLAEQD